MPKWYKFTTGEVEALKAILEDDTQQSGDYADHMDNIEEDVEPELGRRRETMQALARKAAGEVILEKLEHGGQEVKND